MSGTTNQAPAGAAATASVTLTQADIDSARAEGHAAGRDAIRAACVQMREFYSKLAEGTAPKKPPRLRHFVGNRVIDVHGDNARAWAYWLDLNNDNVQRWPYVAGYGYYVDDLLRTSDGWRFTRRKVTNEITGESSLELPLAVLA